MLPNKSKFRTIDIPKSTANSDGYLSKEDWATFNAAAGGGITGLSGDVTATGPGVAAATIANDAVTYAKMQNVTASRLLGRATASLGNVEEIILGTGLSFSGTTLNADVASAVWGSITGTLSNQTDLQNALNAKLNLSGGTMTGDLDLGIHSLTLTGSIATTGARVTKGWFTDLEVTNAIVGSITGNAATATLATNATNIGITNDVSTNAAMYPVWVTANTGNLPAKVSSTELSFNPSLAQLTATQYQVSGNVSLASWGLNGVGLYTTNSTYTDTTSSGTVAQQVAYAFIAPTFAATNVTSYTATATVYISGPINQGTNVTIGSSAQLALWVDNGRVRFDQQIGMGLNGTPSAWCDLGGNISATDAALGVNGIGLRVRAFTTTDTTSSGTVASIVANAFGIPTFAATSATTYTDVATVYIAGVPLQGSNVTISARKYALWTVGASRFDGTMSIGTSTIANSRLTIGGTGSNSSQGTGGVFLRVQAATHTDSTGSGTIASMVANSFGVPTFAGSSSITITDAANLYLDIPAQGSNMTFTNTWSLWTAGAIRVDGLMKMNAGVVCAYVAKTANYTITTSDYTVDCTANSFTVTLPTAVGVQGQVYNIINSGSGTITLATTSSQTIGNISPATTWTINPGEVVNVQSDNANWKFYA